MKPGVKQFFQDDSGMYSSSRLMFILSGIVVLGIWAFQCIKESKMVSMDLTAVGYVTAMMTGKIAAQHSDNITDSKRGISEQTTTDIKS